MAISARPVTGGILIENVPLDVSVIYMESSANPMAAQTERLGPRRTTDFTADGVGPNGGLVGTFGFLPTAGAAHEQSEGDTIYFSTIADTPIANAEASAVLPAMVDPFVKSGSVTGLDTVNVSSGQVRADFAAPGDPGTFGTILRYCIEVAESAGTWARKATEDIADVGAIRSGMAAPALGLGDNGDLYIQNGEKLLRKTGIFDDTQVSFADSSIEKSPQGTAVINAADTNIPLAWTVGGTQRRFAFANIFANGDVQVGLNAGALTEDARLSLRFKVVYDGTTYVFNGPVADTSSPYRWAPSNAAEAIALAAAMSAGESATATISLENGGWQDVAGFDFSGSQASVRTGATDPAANLGSNGDAYLRLVGTTARVWRKETSNALTPIMAYRSGETLTGLTNGTEYDLSVQVLTWAGLGAKARTTFTPSATPDAPARRNVRAINGHGEVLTVWDKPDDVRAVDVEFRPSETDPMGNTEGHQTVVEDFNGQRYSVRGLPMGSEARVRVNAKRNPETESEEAVVPRVGISTSGLPIPPGCYDEPPDAEFVWACQQNLRPAASGDNAGAKGLYYNDWQRYQQIAARIEDPDEWVSGRSYYEGDDVFVYQIVHSTTGTFEFQQGAECILDHEAASARTRPFTGEDWRRYWRAKPRAASLDPADAPSLPEPTEVEPATPGQSDTTPEPSFLSSVSYNNVEAAGGSVFDRRADNAGEIQFGAFIDGSYRHNGRSWERAKRETDLLTLSVSDMNGADQQVLLFSAFPGSYVTVRESAGRWIRYLIEARDGSNNGLRVNFQVKPDRIAESAGTHDFTGSETLEIRFSFSAPMETFTEGAAKKPKRVGPLAKTASTADTLTIGITAPASDAVNDAATRYYYRYIDRNLPSPRWSDPVPVLGEAPPMPFVRMPSFVLTGLTIDYDVDVQVWSWNEGGHGGFRGLNDLTHA